jgi:hypothetical protein
MRRIRAAALLIVAACGVGASLTASASAQPVFLTKSVVPEGSSIPLTGTLGVSALEGKGGGRFSCLDKSGAKLEGDVVGPKTVKKVVITFTECGTGEFNRCGSNEPARITVTHALEGELGPVSPTLPGIRLWAEGDKGGLVMEFICGEGAIVAKVIGTITGSISGAAGENAETGNLLSSMTLMFAEKAGIQRYQGFEGGELGEFETSVSGKPFAKSGESFIAKMQTVPSTWKLGVTK